ncbi:MAG: ATP-dependent helicase [Bacillaceae bacterium]|jgi:Superfamily II DNA/RNA helicases, SNF2 family|uniref:ATP-dependent helicase n=1 Tax=Aeribacillus pallidus TaxID=33936 RepID=A0A165XRX0_9BACI|nr:MULTISPECIES: SNF2-related protein [Aeribacillus]REJ18521.1 MAG: ATP-dependent helicase [Bacillaceae bacterium]KZN96343.1 ATP-dependent helicase [Aeribacillus pallidus]MED1442144.1 SNF2-related protein [Aeribacillus composti]REJ25377.1 MAG: ATP-dependent helicase [Bacillaceae bacterium]BBU40181.1 putative ATP-dependent helicase YqhH [Aeribacillus pallidus]
MNINIRYKTTWEEEFLQRLKEDGPWANWELYKLAYEVTNYLSIPSFEGLVAPLHLDHVTPLPHQLEVAQTVVEKLNGKAILADEVGLGKTIEAGLILKEYMIRGLVKKVLILVPASLVSQWVRELNEKFYIPAVEQKKSYVWEQCDVVVSSLDTAKRSPHKEIIHGLDYDMVIIDEAHKLKNNKTKNYEFVQNLKKKFCLLLTATPIQNRIEEIFNLVSLLKPGHLGNEQLFHDMFKKKGRNIRDDEHLRELVNKVMIRNRRIDTGIEWSKRHVETIWIQFSEAEKALYDAISQIRSSFSIPTSSFSILTLQREACSSREAVYITLKKMLDKKDEAPQLPEKIIRNLMGYIDQVTKNSKAEKTVELIQNINDKVIIFTEYRATQLYLQWFLKQHGITSVPFRGGFKRGKKDWMKDLFKNRAQVLIATEAGGEGINLQFCNHIINYDLPWNPMRLEQRIGRIHRLGQERDVFIYNMATKNTVEEHILKLLYEKINLFERVIGELDSILAKLDLRNIHEHIEDIMIQSSSEGEMKIKMENLAAILNFGEQLQQAENN